MADEIMIVDNEYATLVCLPDEKIIYHTFHKPIGGEILRNVLNKGTEAMAKYGATKWLSDDRLNAVLSPEDTEFGKTDWFPRTLQAGWKYWALVVPSDILGQMSLKEIIDDYWERGLRIMVFSKLDEAREWLTNIA